MRTLKQILQNDSEAVFLQRCYFDFKLWVERVFDLECTPFHLEWIKAIESHRRTNITAPTGFGKTQIVGICYFLWKAWFKKNKDFLIVAKALPQSTKILSRMIDAITDNELLLDLVPQAREKTWTKTEITTTTNCHIFVKPYSENIKSYHVDYLLPDEVASYKNHEIFKRFVVTRVEAKDGKICAISTPDNVADLMQELNHNPEWHSMIYKAIQDDGTPLWPSRFPIEKLERIKRDIGNSAFEREYLCNPKAAAENAVYPPEYIEACLDYNSRFKLNIKEGMVVIGADFAIAKGPTADFDSYSVVQRLSGKAILIYGERHKGITIAAKVARLEDLYSRYNAMKIILDPSSVGSAVLEELRNKCIPVEAADFAAAARNKLLVNLIKMIEPELDKDGNPVKLSAQLVIPKDPKCELTANYVNILLQEFISFRETKSEATKMTSYQSSAPHDDTVISLALACKGIVSQREYIDLIAV